MVRNNQRQSLICSKNRNLVISSWLGHWLIVLDSEGLLLDSLFWKNCSLITFSLKIWLFPWSPVALFLQYKIMLISNNLHGENASLRWEIRQYVYSFGVSRGYRENWCVCIIICYYYLGFIYYYYYRYHHHYYYYYYYY